MRTRRFWVAVLLLAATAATAQVANAQAVGGAQANSGDTAPAESAEVLRPVLVEASEAALAAVQTGDGQALAKVAMPDLIFVAPPRAAASEKNKPGTCAMGTASVGNPQVMRITPMSAVLVYTLHPDSTCPGLNGLADRRATDNFVKQDGKWLISLHTEAAAVR